MNAVYIVVFTLCRLRSSCPWRDFCKQGRTQPVDCIDCAADASVVGAVNEGIDVAASIVPTVQRPWVMVSVNDDCRDLHFRKAAGLAACLFKLQDFLTAEKTSPLKT